MRLMKLITYYRQKRFKKHECQIVRKKFRMAANFGKAPQVQVLSN